MHPFPFYDIVWATHALIPTIFFIPIIAGIVLWSLIWKGLALWLAARNSHRWWFVALLVVNTLGILEIIYIFAVGRQEMKRRGDTTAAL